MDEWNRISKNLDRLDEFDRQYNLLVQRTLFWIVIWLISVTVVTFIALAVIYART